MADQAETIRGRVRAAFESGAPLAIEGGGTKRFLGRTPAGEPLAVAGHHGIVRHEPSELVLTVRAGTPVAETQAALAEHGQWLPFDPPRHGDASTIGGVVACALSGPTRPWTGAVRDFVLGTRVVNGRGDLLSFGGEVMKNVAGYDVSRLMAGALGTLGVILEVSFKLLPRPSCDRTRVCELAAGEAIRRLTEWARSPLPILGACHDGERLHVRLAGAEPAVDEAAERTGGEPGTVRSGRPSATTATPSSPRTGRRSGGSRFPPTCLPSICPTPRPASSTGAGPSAGCGAMRRRRCCGPPRRRAGGHATCFRGGDREAPFHPLAEGLDRLHARLKDAFDPRRILNPGRLYADL